MAGLKFFIKMNALTTTIEQKPKHIAVAFPCLATDPVVLPELVCLVHASHKLIVFNNTGRIWNLLDTAIAFSPLNCGVPFWMAVRRHEVYQLPVSPHTGHQIVSLTGHGLASLQVTRIWYVYSIATCIYVQFLYNCVGVTCAFCIVYCVHRLSGIV